MNDDDEKVKAVIAQLEGFHVGQRVRFKKKRGPTGTIIGTDDVLPQPRHVVVRVDGRNHGAWSSVDFIEPL